MPILPDSDPDPNPTPTHSPNPNAKPSPVIMQAPSAVTPAPLPAPKVEPAPEGLGYAAPPGVPRHIAAAIMAQGGGGGAGLHGGFGGSPPLTATSSGSGLQPDHLTSQLPPPPASLQAAQQQLQVGTGCLPSMPPSRDLDGAALRASAVSGKLPQRLHSRTRALHGHCMKKPASPVSACHLRPQNACGFSLQGHRACVVAGGRGGAGGDAAAAARVPAAAAGAAAAVDAAGGRRRVIRPGCPAGTAVVAGPAARRCRRTRTAAAGERAFPTSSSLIEFSF